MKRGVTDWLDYFENSKQPEIQLGLARVSAVAARLHLTNLNANVITVAGTNGKGSTVSALEAIYFAAGYQVATYTSPHLLFFNERIRINKQPISDGDLCQAFSVVEEAREDIHLTYFEMATLAALWYFKQHQLDVVILEVGMGGRLDATNLLSADVAVISTIDLDHQAYLGETKDAIGYEKAGILRRDKPCIYADDEPPLSVVSHAQAVGAPLYGLDVDYSFKVVDHVFQVTCISGERVELPIPRLHLKAASAAIMVTCCLREVLPVSVQNWADGMSSVSIFGRQQMLKESGITTILDVAHNPQAVMLLADRLENLSPKGRVHAVFSALKDKDLCGLIRPMRPWVHDWYPALLQVKRAANWACLQSAFHMESQVVTGWYASPKEAYDAARQQAKSGDLIVVYGSFMMVSAIMDALGDVLESAR